MAAEKKNIIVKNILRKIRGYYTDTPMGVGRGENAYPYRNYDLLSWVLADPILRASLEIKHSTISKVNYFFTDITKKDEEKLKKMRFDKWHLDSWWQELIYRNSFTEINKDASNNVVSLPIIKTDEMDIVNTPTGEVIKYLQYPSNNMDGPYLITLPKDKIIHIAINNIDTGLWGMSDLPTIIPLIKKKNLVEDFINWMFESNQFRAVLRVNKKMDETEVDEMIENMRASMVSPTKLLLLWGEDSKLERLREIDGFEQLIKLLDYYRSLILAVLQLPPLQVGILENSNRSSSEYQIRYSFYTHIQGLLKAKEDEINNEVLPAIGIKATFKYKFVDDKTRSDCLDTAVQLANLGGDLVKINKWLIDKGMDIPDDLFNQAQEQKEKMNENQNQMMSTQKTDPVNKTKLDKNSTLHPSRKPTEMDFAGGSRKK